MNELDSVNADTDGWPEITYGYVMHYYWEPQHLLRTVKSLADAVARHKDPWTVVDAAMRSQEVPLNYLFNVLLRLGPTSMRSACLARFGVAPDPALASLSLRRPGEFKLDGGTKVQPDVHLESESARIFIELKLGAKLNVKQIDKYVRLHRILDEAQGVAKRGWILLLVKNDPVWLYASANEATRLTDLPTPVTDLPEQLSGMANLTTNNVKFGATTWNDLAIGLQEYLLGRGNESTDAQEMLETLIGDFLHDLGRKRLLRSGTAAQSNPRGPQRRKSQVSGPG
jgi:hypothetical protein